MPLQIVERILARPELLKNAYLPITAEELAQTEDELAPAMHIKELFQRSNYAGLSEAERRIIEAMPDSAFLRQAEIWQAVEVINATAEKDGTFKRYFLAVPPEMTTAREAVAWTFGMTADEYKPEVEK